MKVAFRILCLCLGAMIGAGGTLPVARAQTPERGIILAQAERQKRPGIFRFLFKNRRERQVIVPAPQLQPPARQLKRQQAEPRQAEPKQKSKSKRKREGAKAEKTEKAAKPKKQRKKRAVAAAPAAREIKAVEKAPDAKRVLVIGDFLADAMSKGLEVAYKADANVVVVDATSGDSGLVRTDHYDWPAKLPELVAEHKPDAVLALIGANDRQPISTDAGAQELDGEGWRAAYGVRVSALADALKATGKPVLWAGLVPVRRTATSRGFSTMNGIVREQVESKGLRFVDTWNGFANEEGKFVAEGPDISGRSVQLRDSDGLNFTKAGQRKLAYFVEQELKLILGGGGPQIAALDPAALNGAQPGLNAPAEAAPLISPMVPIEAVMTGDGEFLSAAAAPGAPSDPAVVTAVARRLSGDGEVRPPAGRTDNYLWPAPRLAAP
ncbi:MAG: DUF459 domain-containing protein, partial [Rhizobiales bacterium]|nr:DUF459 domain-containing protein [Hyphomicrobiales bacterium]